jgi:hypothetical protein
VVINVIDEPAASILRVHFYPEEDNKLKSLGKQSSHSTEMTRNLYAYPLKD